MMLRVQVLCLAFLAVAATAYRVHEEVIEDDESVRGKRQESSGAYIDSIFNIPITAIKQTSVAAQTLSPANAATIDSVLKIPVTTLQAVSALIKNRQQQQQLQQSTSTTSRPIRRQDEDEAVLRRRDELKRRMDLQRERQRLWEEQLHRRRMDQLERYSRRMQQRIQAESESNNYYKDPFGFSAVSKWIVGHPHRVLSTHTGHGDGHVYQYYNRDKPLHFGLQPAVQGTYQPTPTKPTVTTSTASSSTQGAASTASSSTTTTTTGQPGHLYAVHEIVDEGANPFAWPNWFGIINVLKKTKVEPPVQNKIAQKDDDYYKYKYAQARKNEHAGEQEITGNELDADVAESAELPVGPREGRVLFPTN